MCIYLTPSVVRQGSEGEDWWLPGLILFLSSHPTSLFILWSSNLMCLSGHPTLCVSRAIRTHMPLVPSNLTSLSGHPTSCASPAIQSHVPLWSSNRTYLSCHPTSCVSPAIQLIWLR